MSDMTITSSISGPRRGSTPRPGAAAQAWRRVGLPWWRGLTGLWPVVAGPGPLSRRLAAVPGAVLGTVLAALMAWGAFAGYLFPLRPDVWFAAGHPFTVDHRLDSSWGGPTLVGAWFIHGCVAFAFQAAELAVLRRLAARRDRQVR